MNPAKAADSQTEGFDFAVMRPNETKGGELDGAGLRPSYLSESLTARLRSVSALLAQQVSDLFSAVDLSTAEFFALAHIAHRPGSKQGEIAAQLSIKRSNFVVLMDRMETHGLAERRSTDDRRAHVIHLTEEGKSRLEQAMTLWQDHERRLLGQLGGIADKISLLQMLDLLSEQ